MESLMLQFYNFSHQSRVGTEIAKHSGLDIKEQFSFPVSTNSWLAWAQNKQIDEPNKQILCLL